MLFELAIIVFVVFVLPVVLGFVFLDLLMGLIFVLLVFVIGLIPGVLQFVEIALLFLLFPLGVHLVEDEVVPAPNLLQHEGRQFVLLHNFAVNGDFLIVCEQGDGVLALLLAELALLVFGGLEQHCGFAVLLGTRHQVETHRLLSIEVLLSHFNNQLL
jgi:hypothetical protein